MGSPRTRTIRPNIKDVAAAAGVATSTVSRILASDEFGTATTRDRVLKAVRRLGYDHAPRTRGAAPGAGALGLIITELANPFFAGLSTAVLQAARTRDHAVLLADPEDLAAGGLAAALDLAQQCTGLIVWAPAVNDTVIEDLSSRTRCALINGQHATIPSVSSYGADAVDQAFTYLAELGHRRFAYVVSSARATRSLVERLEAARAAAHRLDVEMHVVEAHGQPAESARYAVDMISAHGATAVVAQNDLMAMSLARRYSEIGLSIPGHVSIVGCDDNPAAALFTPSLTTMALPVRALAARAVDLVLTETIDQVSSDVLAAHLVVRESTGHAPRHH